MSIKSPTIKVDSGNPFLHCKLGRQKYAHTIFKLIENHPSGFVLALNNKWGTGKTTFVQMLQKKLELESFSTIYFNAWEQDNETNPLNVFVGEFTELLDKGKEKKLDKLIKNASVIAKTTVPAVVKGVISKFIGNEAIKEIVETFSKGAGDVFKTEVDAYLERKKAIVTFRAELTSFVNELTPEKSLVIFIDELDRCRPDYAVLLLEQIKHLFAIPNIVFVLSIDKNQLSNAIKGYYGSENIDTGDYLKRFIDFEYSLPEPEFKLYYRFLLKHYKIREIISQKGFHKPDDVHDRLDQLIEILMYNHKGKITLRQQEKFFTHFSIALSLLDPNKLTNMNFFTLLVFFKFFSPSLYKGLKDRTIPFDSYQDYFLREFSDETKAKYKQKLSFDEFTLGVAYHEFTKPTNNDKLFNYNAETSEVNFVFNSKIFKLPDMQCKNFINQISENPVNHLWLIFEIIEMADLFD